MERIWQKSYPKDLPTHHSAKEFDSIADVLGQAVSQFHSRIAYVNMGVGISFDELDLLAGQFASYLQHECGLVKGDRIAIQMPNLLQFPVALFGALRAGLTVVNTNPLYTAREMEHQFRDSGAKAIVILANYAHLIEKILLDTEIEHIIVTEVGDLFPFYKKIVTNTVVRCVKKLVPPYRLNHYTTFNNALSLGQKRDWLKVDLQHSDIAFLQYTGGTTGVSKGAILTHGNILSNMNQIYIWMAPVFKVGQEVGITALPMYHIFSLTVNCLSFMRLGISNVLVTNPKDIDSYVKILKETEFTVTTGVNTLFNALMNHPQFASINFSKCKVSVAGGMALQTAVASRWRELTGTPIAEGYGLTESSPVVCCNLLDGNDRPGSIGLPLPDTDIKIVDDDGNEVKMGESGEIWVSGPQVMQGYWKNPDETANILTTDGWLKTGDIGVVDPDGFFKIVDRKKDMILVSGFNVYPNEIEDVLVMHPKVLEVAAVGYPDPHSGEVVKVFIVPKTNDLTEDEIKKFAKKELTNYKVPKLVEFRKELPKSNVGKILRRALRE